MVEGSGPTGLRRDPTAQTVREIRPAVRSTRRLDPTFPDHHSGGRPFRRQDGRPGPSSPPPAPGVVPVSPPSHGRIDRAMTAPTRLTEPTRNAPGENLHTPVIA